LLWVPACLPAFSPVGVVNACLLRPAGGCLAVVAFAVVRDLVVVVSHLVVVT